MESEDEVGDVHVSDEFDLWPIGLSLVFDEPGVDETVEVVVDFFEGELEVVAPFVAAGFTFVGAVTIW